MSALYIINLIFCILIVIVGLIRWKKTQKSFFLHLGIAFGLFGISYLFLVFGLTEMEVILIAIRIVGYLIILYTLDKAVLGSK